MHNIEIIFGWIAVILAACGIYFQTRSPETKDKIVMGICVFCCGGMGISILFLLIILVVGTVKAIR